MLRIKNDVNLKCLESFGFRLSACRSFYYFDTDEAQIFVWITRGYDYKPRCLYIETKPLDRIIIDLSIIYDLISAGIVEVI